MPGDEEDLNGQRVQKMIAEVTCQTKPAMALALVEYACTIHKTIRGTIAVTQ
jgi:hypothetical protein